MAKHTANGKVAGRKAKQGKATLSLGELVSAAFDQAYAITKNQQQAAALASIVVQRMLERSARNHSRCRWPWNHLKTRGHTSPDWQSGRISGVVKITSTFLGVHSARQPRRRWSSSSTARVVTRTL